MEFSNCHELVLILLKTGWSWSKHLIRNLNRLMLYTLSSSKRLCSHVPFSPLFSKSILINHFTALLITYPLVDQHVASAMASNIQVQSFTPENLIQPLNSLLPCIFVYHHTVTVRYPLNSTRLVRSRSSCNQSGFCWTHYPMNLS